VERTAVLLHLIDVYSDDVAAAYRTIRSELANYSPELITRPEVVAITKTEGLDDDIVQMQIDAVKKEADTAIEVFAISSSAHKGLTDVLRALKAKVQAERSILQEIAEDDDDMPVIKLGAAQIAEAWTIEKDEESGHFIVTGDKIEKFARRTNFDNFEGLNRLRDIMKRLGITHELTRAGAKGDSSIEIGGKVFTLVEQ
jgi:GTP-binding protein